MPRYKFFANAVSTLVTTCGIVALEKYKESQRLNQERKLCQQGYSSRRELLFMGPGPRPRIVVNVIKEKSVRDEAPSPKV